MAERLGVRRCRMLALSCTRAGEGGGGYMIRCEANVRRWAYPFCRPPSPPFTPFPVECLVHCPQSSWYLSLLFLPVAANATAPVPVPAEVQAQLGNSNQSAPSSLYFRGRANLVAITSYLTTHLGMNDSVTDIVLSGGSAGATSTYAVLDAFAGWFPKARVTGAPDAGFFLDAFNIGYNTTWYR